MPEQESEQSYPCRCGLTHLGEEGYQDYRSHQCFHTKLQIIDTTNSGDFVVFCDGCETAWIAPCVAEGVSLTITKSAMARGCDMCRGMIMEEIKLSVESINHDCPYCGEKWVLRRGPGVLDAA